MTAPFDLARALDYPYAIPGRSYRLDVARGTVVEHDNVTMQCREAGTYDGVTLYDVDGKVDGTPFALKEICFVVAAGSNASPQQLLRKYRDTETRNLLCLRRRVHGVASVYSAHFASYGAIAACLHPVPEATGSLVLNLLDREALARMHETESLGVNYRFARLSHARIEPDDDAAKVALYGYHSLHGPLRCDEGHPVRLGAFAAGRSDMVSLHHHDVLRHVARRLAPGIALETVLAEIVRDADARGRATAALKHIRIPRGDAP
jgi:hypothetical protein